MCSSHVYLFSVLFFWFISFYSRLVCITATSVIPDVKQKTHTISEWDALIGYIYYVPDQLHSFGVAFGKAWTHL